MATLSRCLRLLRPVLASLYWLLCSYDALLHPGSEGRSKAEGLGREDVRTSSTWMSFH